MTFEQLFLFAIFVLMAVGNAIFRWLQRRMADASRDTAPPDATQEAGRVLPPPVPLPPPAPPRARVVVYASPSPEVARTSPAASVAAAPPRSPSAQRARIRLRGQADIRRAVVLIAVLGPCRADDPP